MEDRVYDIFLKSGDRIINAVLTDSTKSLVSLWNWSLKKRDAQVLTFKNGLHVLSTEIAAIKEVK